MRYDIMRAWTRRQATKFLVVALVTCLIAAVSIAAIGHVPAATTEFQSRDRAAMAELMAYYSTSDSLVGDSWWQSAVAVDTAARYEQTTGDDEFSYVYTTAFARYRGRFNNSFMDDTAWWALAWVRVYDLTQDQKYLFEAVAQANYLNTSWDTTCGGGIWWSTGRNYKNAIANELFLQLNAALHNRVSGDQIFLSRAQTEWSWFQGSGLINADGLVNDGLDESCHNNGAPTWSYNQGVILAGLAELYTATSDAALLTTARDIANSEIRSSTPDGVLQEWCEPGTYTINQALFKGVFVTDLQELIETARTTDYAWFIRKQRNSLLEADFNSSSAIGVSWDGPWYAPSAATQISGINALLSSLRPYSKPVTVTFDSAGGTAVPAVHLRVSEVVTAPQPPFRTGYIFQGWYHDDQADSVWDFSQPVETDLILHARWQPEREPEKVRPTPSASERMTRIP